MTVGVGHADVQHADRRGREAGRQAAIGFVRLAKPTSAMSWRQFMAPMTVPHRLLRAQPGDGLLPEVILSQPQTVGRFGASRRSP